MNQSAEPQDAASPYSGTRGHLLRAGWLVTFLGAVAFVAPFILPAWTQDGIQPPLSLQILQYPNARLSPAICGWGLVATLPLVIASSQAFRRSPHESALPIAAASLLIGLAFFLPMFTNVVSDLTTFHAIQRLRDSIDWLTFVGSFLIVAGNLIVLAMIWIVSWSDPRA